MNGVRFYNVIWETEHNGFHQTVEAETSRRRLHTKIKNGEIEYFFGSGQERGQVLKIQEMETPLIELSWLLECFTTGGTKESREEHKQQAAYVLRLVEHCAARVISEDGETVTER